jgi:transcriptional regulator with XRE-family HTH domain
MRRPSQIRETIKELLKAKGTNESVMLKELGFNSNVMASMDSRGSMPSVEKLAGVARYLSVSVEYLLGLEPQSHASALDAFNALPPEAKKACLLDEAEAAGVAVVSAEAARAAMSGGEPAPMESRIKSAKELWDLVGALLGAKGVSAYRMQKDLGLSKSFVSDMAGKGSMPSAEKLAKIALYLGVSADHLLGLETRGPETLLERFEAMQPGEQERFLVEAALGLKKLEPGKGALVLLRDAGPAGEA